MDLQMNSKALDTWEDILRRAFEVLKSFGVVSKLTEDTLFGMQGTEHKVSNVFRHTDSLLRVTKGFFEAPGNQKYYLNLFKPDITNHVEALRKLFKLVFGNTLLSPQDREKIHQLCDEVATTKNIYIFDIAKHKFHNAECSFLIRDALLTL